MSSEEPSTAQGAPAAAQHRPAAAQHRPAAAQDRPTATQVFRALGDATRWRIVRLVLGRALCVCELADILGLPHSSTSSHLQIIRKAGLLDSERCGKWTYYRIHREHLPLIRNLLKQFPDEPVHHDDEQRCLQRLADRANSCCPGPIELAKPRRQSTKN